MDGRRILFFLTASINETNAASGGHFTICGNDGVGYLIAKSCPKWPWVRDAYPKWNHGKWNQRLNPAVPWWLHFDPYLNDFTKGWFEQARKGAFKS